MRLIDADAFEVVFFENKSEEFVEGATCILEMIDEASTVEAKPVVHGEWKSELGLFFPVYRCSECNYASALGKTNFCPYCGADMRKKVE